MCDKREDDDKIWMIRGKDPLTGWTFTQFLTQEEMDDLEGDPDELIEKYDPDDDY